MKHSSISLILLLVLTILFFGCITQKEISIEKNEKVIKKNEVDIDDDGLWDYATYTFEPVKIENEQLQIQRWLFISNLKKVTLSSSLNLTDYTVESIYDKFEGFSKNIDISTKKCSNSLGLIGAICIDTKTCAKLCAAFSSKCSAMVDSYEAVIGNSIKSFVKNDNEMSTTISEIKKDLVYLKDMSENEKKELAQKIELIVGYLSAMNSELIVAHPSLTLCQQDNYDAKQLKNILDEFAVYTKEVKEYYYLLVISIEDIRTENKGWLPKSLIITDNLAKSGINTDEISSPHLEPQYKTLSINESESIISFKWEQVDPYSKGETILIVRFSSKNPPATIITSLSTPVIMTKTIDITAALPTILIFDIAHQLFKNPQFALGFAFAVTIAVLLLIYRIAVIAYYVFSAVMAGETTRTGIRRAVARTRLQWKSDLLTAIILLIVSFAASFQLAPKVITSTIFETVDYLVRSTEYFSIIGMLTAFFGILILYLAAENKVKISFLENEYGRKIKEEKDLFNANAAQLKAKINELKSITELVSGESVDVSREYALIEEYSQGKINNLTKKMDAYSKQSIEHALLEVELALQRLSEKKKLIIDNWQRWNETITSAIEENEEVSTNMLLGIPPSLRIWALTKYAKEHTDSNLVYEGDVLKRRSVNPDMAAKEMIRKGLVTGMVLVRDGKIIFVQIAKGSTGVTSVLAIKLINYTLSLVKKLGQHTYSTIAAVGDRLVLVLMHHSTVDAIMFIEKDKFKNAIEEWKNKLKLIEKG